MADLPHFIPPLPAKFLRLPALLLSFLGASLSAAEYYVAPDGDDAHEGSKEQPFGTIQRAQKAANPGDTVYLRGGTYVMRPEQIARTERLYAYVSFLDKSGRPGAPIRYWAYADERPVFDFTAIKPARVRIAAFYTVGSWLHLKGIDVRGVQVTQKGHTQSICFFNEGSHNILEDLSMHDGQAIGIYTLRGSDNLFLNCDAYQNHDYTSENGKGGNVDGFGCHPAKGATGNVFRGCRAWCNSDDGYDCISAHESVTFEHCWAFNNGLSAAGERLADGNGFKAGGYASLPASQLPAPIPRHVVRFCLAVDNRSSGFYANHHPGGGDWINNSAYRNGTNFNLLNRELDNVTDIPGRGQFLRNNLAFGSPRAVANLNTARSDSANNSFDLGLKLTAADFQNLDVAELRQPRQKDGSLPPLRFFRPVPGSKLFESGVETGAPFTGRAPALGVFDE